jgi:hypothetical protein
MPKGIFLCYRRDDTAGYAGRLYDRLKSRFPHRVFMDVGEIPPGADFVATIDSALGGCAVLVALIGRQWSSEGRLDDPADLVRVEIATALRRGVRVVPVLLRGAAMPLAGSLPADLAALALRQALTLSDEDWGHDCDRLIAALLPEVGAPRSRHRRLAWATMALVLLAVVTALVWPRIKPAPSPVPVATDTSALTSGAQKYTASQVNALNQMTTAMDRVGQLIADANKPSPTSAPSPFDPVGRWRVEDRKPGDPETLTLQPGGALEVKGEDGLVYTGRWVFDADHGRLKLDFDRHPGMALRISQQEQRSFVGTREDGTVLRLTRL